MKRTMTRAAWIALLLAVVATMPVRAENEGLAELDEATALKVAAQTSDDLAAVIGKCEAALRLGLDEDNELFAKQLLASTLFQRGGLFAERVLAAPTFSRQWQRIRESALADLERAISYDTQFGDAYYLIARLHTLPGGDKEAGMAAADKAVQLAGDDNRRKARALIIRGGLRGDEVKMLADFDEAVRADPDSQDARRIRGLYYLQKGENEKAAEDFAHLVEADDDNASAHAELAEALMELGKHDEARQHIDQALELRPGYAVAYKLRAKVHLLEENLEAAIADLDDALHANPRDLSTMLMRSHVKQMAGKVKEAKEDVDRALALQPGLVQAIAMRSLLSAELDQFDEAIADMEKLARADPENVEWKLQLGSYQVAAKRPRKAVEIFTSVIGHDPENILALRGRGDARLNYGQHAEAIADYEAVLKIQPEHSGVLNNLAWTLATSPDDKLRDGERAVKLATTACEETEFKQAHILSTLAAAYAEIGDFESAVKWSTKAVEAAPEELKEQVAKELESYRQQKPWRELHETEDAPEPGPFRGGELKLPGGDEE
jgi:tetratricopeptide (TPR) repeat protein